jgi:hypothetical protein
VADGYAVVVANGPAFEAAMTEIQRDLANPAGPLDATARATLDASRAGAPRLTGRLAGAGRVEEGGPGRARLLVDTDYAAPIHWGWPAHNIRRRPWVTAAFRRDPKPMAALAKGIQADIDKAAAKT